MAHGSDQRAHPQSAGFAPWPVVVGVRRMRIHCLIAGAGADPVVLLHGGGIDSAALTYRHTLAALAQRHRVYAPDWPGYGRSSAPDRTPDLAFHVNLLEELLDALGLAQASLVGVSLGGGAALGFALRWPERVRRLALVASYGLGNAVPWDALGALLVRLPGLAGLSWALLRRDRGLLRRALGGVVSTSAALTDELVDEAWASLRRPDVGRAFGGFQRAEVGWGGLRTDFSTRLHELAMPVLLVHGAHDRSVPVAWAQRAEHAIPDAHLQIFERSGHWPPREEPERFNQTIAAFLRDS
ncbi:MAG TPA: alpha/beta fold hydrolase [Chloroflexaceae bacterium]|nr:alpha/beta fold hydrolase [Chloroflexaceae bacterium]